MIMEEPQIYKKKKWKPQFSKLLPIVTLAVWVACLLRGLTIDLTNVLDTAIFTVSITVSGGIFGMIAKSYNSKSKAENIAQIQKDTYAYTTKVQLWAIEKLALIKKQYSLTDEDIYEMRGQLTIDEEVDKTYQEIDQNLDAHKADTLEVDDVQSY